MTRTQGNGNGGEEELRVDRAGVVASSGGVHDLYLNLAEVEGEGQKDH